MFYIILIVYQIIYILFLPFAFIIYGIISIFEKENRRKFFDRFLIKSDIQKLNPEKKYIWLHCLSLGEVRSATKFVKEILKEDYGILISTTTHTGYNMLRKTFKDKLICLYTPYDFYPIISHLYKKVKPIAYIIIEWDLWPFTIHFLHKKNVPLFLINARLGKEGKNYYKLKFFFNKLFSAFNLIVSQTDEEFKQIKSLSVTNNVVEGGNLKYDVEKAEPKSLQEINLNVSTSLKDIPIVCAGSTHNPEEELIINAYKDISQKHKLKLILAPRNPERYKEIANLCIKYGLKYDIRSEGIWKENILIVDTIGELLSFYNIADIVIMGGSFNKKVQGHNILEPASLGKVIIVGPYMDNFKSIFEEFKNNNAILLSSEYKLRSDILNFLKVSNLRLTFSTKALSLMEKNRGESKKIWNKIKEFLVFNK